MNNLMVRGMIVSGAVLALVMPQSATSLRAYAQTPSTPAAGQAPAAVWKQQSASAGPPARYAAGIAYDESNGSVLMFGGGGSLHQALTRDDTWQWDGASWTELHPAANPSARMYPSMAEYPGGNGVLLFGGLGGDQGSAEPDDETWTWDGGNWTQQQPEVSPPARGAASLASDGHGGMVLFGGTTYNTDGGSVFYDTWVWDGTTWTQQHPTNNPPARAGASMVPDGHGRVVLFGGTSSPYLGQGAPATYGDLWSWDGANWTQLHPSTNPPGRSDGGMVYDPDSHSVVLFSGGSGPTAGAPPGQGTSPPIGLNDIWIWDGTHWTPQQSTAVPSGRASAAMAYDVATDSLVVFGGRAAELGANTGVLGDTWTWGAPAAGAGTASAAPTPAAITPTPGGAGTASLANISGFVGVWYAHEDVLEVHADGSASEKFPATDTIEPGHAPEAVLTLQFTSATPTVATANVVASTSGVHAVGEMWTFTLNDNDTLSRTSGGGQYLDLCGPNAPAGWCGA